MRSDGMPTLLPRLARIVRTLVVALLTGAAAGLLAFGPRDGASNAGPPAGFTTVEYWQGWSGDEEAAMRQIVADFNATVGREKRIFVRCLSMSGMDQKTLVATAAGVPPDVAGLYSQQVPQFAALDALEPLDELAAAHGIDSAYYKKVFWEHCHYEGRLFALVSTAYDLALYYNTAIFRERADSLRAAGLDPDRPPRTLGELDAYAAALDRFDANGKLIRRATCRSSPVGSFPTQASGSAAAGGTRRAIASPSPTHTSSARTPGCRAIPSGWAARRSLSFARALATSTRRRTRFWRATS
jgi:ABC-type glycerol-3-phosphate transport system substrate-binding protein